MSRGAGGGGGGLSFTETRNWAEEDVQGPRSPPLLSTVNKHGVEVKLIEGSVLAHTRDAHRLSHYVRTAHGSAKQHEVASPDPWLSV